MTARRRVFSLILAGLAAGPGVAGEIDHAAEYDACMALAERDAEEAFESALAWRDMGGGDAADHCIAKALFVLGQYGEAARRLEGLAERIAAGPAFKAALLDQAAQGWLLADDPGRAEGVLTAALKLAPGDADLLIDRAVARAAMSRYADAVDDLDRAVEIEPGRADVYALRASAQRYLDSLDLAEIDAERALAIDPGNPQALLERGNIRRLTGDDNGARRDWLGVLDNAPDTPAAVSARANLEAMDVRKGD